MSDVRAREIVFSFVERINAHDVEGLSCLMTEDHLFMDSLGRVVRGRQAMRAAWTEYFGWFPDYQIVVNDVLESGDLIVLLGKASGTYAVDGKLLRENRWKIPAAWRAVVREGLVAEWQVYADNSPAFRILEANRR